MNARAILPRFVLALAATCVTAIPVQAQSQPGLAASSLAPGTSSPPNVVLIITDDLGWSDLSVYGSTDIDTPHIDGLARDGVRMTDFYANAVLCTPTRAGLITGRYQQRYGVEVPHGHEAVSPNAGLTAYGHSLPQRLQEVGYATALVGKWHLGYLPEKSPRAHGFEYFFGLRAGYHDYYTHLDRGGDLDLWENDTPVEIEGYTTDLLTERAVAFVEQNADRPFFLDLSYNAPHWPYQPPDAPSISRDSARHLKPSDPSTSTRADYVAMVERVDQGVGEVLATLERLGLSDNTIVIFTNDNGGEWLSDNRPLFNRKWTVWEGGIRVPTILRWPGQLPAGRVSDQVGITMDLTASILSAAHAPSSDPPLDGIDLFPILRGEAPEVERTLFWRTDLGGIAQKAVRSGNWKLVVHGPHEYIFDLDRDIGERNDLAGRRQDIARTLRLKITEWEVEVDGESATRNGPTDN